AARREARKPPHPDGDFRWRPGRRLDPERQRWQLSRGPLAAGHRTDRDALDHPAGRHRHRTRRHALLPPCRDLARCRGTGRRAHRRTCRSVRRAGAARDASALPLMRALLLAAALTLAATAQAQDLAESETVTATQVARF